MALTNEQLPALKAAIAAETDPTFVEYRTNGDNGGMAAFFNLPSDPAFIVWRTRVTREEIQSDPGFNFTQVDNLSTGSKYRIWDWMFDNAGKTIDASRANIRAGIAATWVGNAQLLAVQAVVLAKCKRAATNGEALFVTGTGTGADPGALVFEGSITSADITNARNLP